MGRNEKSVEDLLEKLEGKLKTPKNFTVREYLNYGRYSVLSENARRNILKEFILLPVEEQQQNLSILWKLQPYRSELGFPLHITCGKRTLSHETSKSRDGSSTHLWGAVDLTCETIGNLEELSSIMEATWVGGFSYYESQRFCHGDIGNNRRW